ncbi:hypothetical protein JSR06_00690 [Candidatus Vidania fulgoroideae]|uniref:Small ribosomal subunit protein uS3 C-terminal domain-containing protein n=1 Tax=Candidatus Vidania fulgoroideorum TaxID=881286 RepID=A0A974X7E4_9PROT|nr:hypothetical protein JSR06_00690 [Candidatus Vidania fulgoroideae]
MGNKVNPLIYRANISNNWRSKWYTENKLALNILLDFEIKKTIEAFISDKIPYEFYIERLEEIIIIVFLTPKRIPNSLKLSSLIEKIESKKCIINNVVSRSFLNSVSSLLHGIKKLILARKNYKAYISKFFYNSSYSNINGIKIIISGRINGIEIARKDIFCIGNISLIELGQFYSYKTDFINTKYGVIGVKIYLSINQF